jgi:hypothetical protein
MQIKLVCVYQYKTIKHLILSVFMLKFFDVLFNNEGCIQYCTTQGYKLLVQYNHFVAQTFCTRPGSVKISSKFHLHLVSYHVSIFMM